MKAFVKRCLIVMAVVVVGLWLNNTSAFETIPDDRKPRLLAHRGIHQIYAGAQKSNETCTANPIKPRQHDFIANTRKSMEAAFAAGADIVELDIHLTPDNVFAVFHDWALDCQTDGTGVTHEQSFEYLRGLDLGYGYSEDGETFPLRGTAIGAMPSLRAVLDASLGGQYLINFKSNRAEDGYRLASFLEASDVSAQIFGVYGGQSPTQSVLARRVDLRGFDKPALKKCLTSYLLLGWSGVVPEACHDTLVALPLDYAPYFWGWPHKFTRRMQSVGSTVILWGPYDGTGFSSGIDSLDTLSKVPDQFDGVIWTNRIERIGPVFADPETR
ncbi:MAG: glycerophosphodiester phosphodiesterase family protein [Aliishimia sp.]